MTPPGNRLLNTLLEAGLLPCAGLDEVGRGALAGPVCVGAVVPGPGDAPEGIKDSKLLTPSKRQALVPKIEQWAESWAIGEASSLEVDELGIVEALTLAANRALMALNTPLRAVMLDGPVNYIVKGSLMPPWAEAGSLPTVLCEPKMDQNEITVGAASILAKEYRDNLMVSLAEILPGYGFEEHMGYGTKKHITNIEHLGPSAQHRLSWKYLDSMPQWQHLKVQGQQLAIPDA